MKHRGLGIRQAVSERRVKEVDLYEKKRAITYHSLSTRRGSNCGESGH